MEFIRWGLLTAVLFALPYTSLCLFLSKGLESALAEKDDFKCVERYVCLCNLNKLLQHSKCQHLVTFLNDTVHFWHNLLKQKFSTWVFFHKAYNCRSSTDKMYLHKLHQVYRKGKFSLLATCTSHKNFLYTLASKADMLVIVTSESMSVSYEMQWK